MPRLREAELSIRLVWPFTRLTAAYAEAVSLLSQVGVTPAIFGNPETRIPHRIAMQLLEQSVRITGDPALGLHAAEQSEAGDFDVVEHVARSAR
jgi:hypothetical protein